MFKLYGLTYKGDAVDDQETFQKLPPYLQGILRQLNGFVVFHGGFHMRGACLEPDWHSLGTVWDGEFAISELYQDIQPDDIPFAEDCVGDQYLLRGEEVLKLWAETGTIEPLGKDLQAFFEAIEGDPVTTLLLQPVIQYENEGHLLQPGECLMVYPPFFARESTTTGYSLRAMSSLGLLDAHAFIAGKLANLPPGTAFRLKTGN